MNTKIVNFIDSKSYEGPDRRERPRYRVLVAAELTAGSKKELVKVLDIGVGGCKLHCSTHLNHHSIITLAFYVANKDKTMEQKYPITGRVIQVHKSMGHYVVWIDFKGMLVQEQGLDDIIKSGKQHG